VRDLELVSPHSIDECTTRLQKAIDNDGPFKWFGSKPVIGHVSGRSVQVRKRISYNNSFQTFLEGTLNEIEGKTLFSGYAGMNPLVAAFSIFVLMVFIIVGSFFFAVGISAYVAGNGEPARELLPLCAMGLGIGFMPFGRWLARGEKEFLIEFVAKTIEAHEWTALHPESATIQHSPM
jgi:hypothetical protein